MGDLSNVIGHFCREFKVSVGFGFIVSVGFLLLNYKGVRRGRF